MEYLKNRIQTIQVGNNETKVEMPYENICIRNIGENTVYASINPDVIPFEDGVLEIKSGEYKVLRDCYKINEGEATCFVYSDNESQIEVESANDVNFFNRAVAKGGGGDTPTDTYTKDQIDSKLLTKVNKQEGYGLSQNDLTNELKNSYDSKLETVELIYNGSKIYLNDEIKLFEDIKELCTNHIYFVYLTYNSTLYIPVFVNSSEIYFDSVVMRSGEATIKRIAITYQETVTTNEMILEQSSRKVTSIDATSTDVQYPSAKAVYNELLNKVGKNDFATKTVGGTVKIDSGYGIEIDNNGTLKTTPAYDNFLQNFADDNHVITPYRFKKAMGLFGINSQTQIADMQTEIDNKVDNDEFVADNMIKFPYQNVPDNIVGATLSVDDDGVITINGNTSRDSSGINLYTHFSLKDGVYTICANSGSTAFGVRVYGKKIGSDANEHLFSVYGNTPYTFTVGEGGFEGYEDFSINGRVTYATSFDNITMKPMLEKGSVAHIYQPYKVSRQSLRDDISDINETMKYHSNIYTVYVNGTTGSDDNDGLSQAKAFKTLYKALSLVSQVSSVLHVLVAPGEYTVSSTGYLSKEFIMNKTLWIERYTGSSTSEAEVIIKGCLRVNYNSCLIMEHLTLESTDVGFSVWDSSYWGMYYIGECASAYFTGCKFNNAHYEGTIQCSSSRVNLVSCTINNTSSKSKKYSVRTSGSTISTSGTSMLGNTYDVHYSTPSFVMSDNTLTINDRTVGLTVVRGQVM